MNAPDDRGRAFHHEALLYASSEEFLAGVLPFVRDGIESGEPTLVALPGDKLALLQGKLGDTPGDGGRELVSFTDMTDLGRNPARIIPAWREFVRERGGGDRRVRGIGEPAWPGRSRAELVECRHHESLLNLALASSPQLWLLCPYDASGLDDDVLEGARATHPFLVENGDRRRSNAYVEPDRAGSPFTGPLAEPRVEPDRLTFSTGRLHALRAFVAEQAQNAGLDRARASDMVLAVNEIASNSVIHAGGGGVLRAWREDETLICEVSDAGRIVEPLVGRDLPLPDQLGGRGIWVANNLCDLVQVRSSLTGTVIRLHMRLA